MVNVSVVKLISSALPITTSLLERQKAFCQGLTNNKGTLKQLKTCWNLLLRFFHRQACIVFTSKMQIQLKDECHPLHTDEKDEHWTAVLNGFKCSIIINNPNILGSKVKLCTSWKQVLIKCWYDNHVNSNEIIRKSKLN